MKDFKILSLGLPVRLSAKEADSLYKELEDKNKQIGELKKTLRQFNQSVRNENELLEMQKNQDVRDLEQQQRVISRLNSYLIKRANEIGECLPMYLVDHIKEFKGGAE
jgi:septal ring factor EnvC (AmiA/AmiB activator)